MSVPMKKSDPAYWMLEEGLSGKREIKKPEVHSESCYICNDPEFALMGLPLCTACYLCGSHVPADDCVCDNGHDQNDDPRFLEQIEEVLIGDQIIKDLVDEKKQDINDLEIFLGKKE